jgi:hypothetical protein
MKAHHLIVAAAVLVLSGVSNAFADCASSPWSSSASGVFTVVCPKVGVGTSTPGAVFHAFENVNGNSFLMIENTNTGLSAAGILRAKSDVATVNFQAHGSGRSTLSRFGVPLAGWNEFLSVAGNGLAIGTLGTTPLVLGTSNLARVTVLADGSVGIGTATPTATLEVNGTIKATTVIGAVYQDVAEWVPATDDVVPGTVVVLNVNENNQVTASTTAYDTKVAGVVSAQPGMILGEGSSSKEMIATFGRVKVHVTASNGPIAIGDLLVTSDVPGKAMRSEPLNLSGAKIHRPGTLIGKALEPLPKGEGEILVLLSMQ